jgi:hypothetical protein
MRNTNLRAAETDDNPEEDGRIRSKKEQALRPTLQLFGVQRKYNTKFNICLPLTLLV